MRDTKHFYLLLFHVIICIKNMRSIPNNMVHLAVVFYYIIFLLKFYLFFNMYFDFTSKSMFDKIK